MCLTINQKKRFKKLLFNGFNNLDYDDIRLGICGLLDYDSKYNTKKLDKYLNKIIIEFKNNPDKLNINQKKLDIAINDFDKLEYIFDMSDEEELEANELLDDKILEVQARRKEILIRRNALKMDRLGIIKKKQRRTIGAMG